jgi:nitrite reductase/ring-hydroxylating ferredoxin subunit
MRPFDDIAKIERAQALDKPAAAVRAVVQRFLKNRAVADALHGVWLGHPLHPVFTDIPVGAWTTGMVLDAVAASRDDRAMQDAADVAMAVGLVGALGSAVTGLTDWSETSGRSRRTGLVHGLLNIAATALYATAYALRRRGSRASGQRYAIAGYTIAMASAYIGGDLVYDERIGVTHAAIEEPEDFTAAAASGDLADNAMLRAHAGEADVLLVRQRGRVCALAHPCAHMAGPLSEGTLKDGSVVCPWHGSEFALEDGHVINGPATQNQPTLVAREHDGHIEVKARE